ncbi:MAG: 50S ribosomal protein L25 [Christensenellales bacterium]|jgi:large subunit ribosomal protein L25|uniref:50S ribosomal protein L25 n=1 Tax=Butyribacter sp. TaxID=2822465 RepID=UPI0003403262|nr:50S ribosomal protein L25 [Clostridium sp.]MDY5179857.1 50S ribosomal protein L25 [Butyribacter sp.]CDB90144.1 ribosomal protein L25 Ctc-form [Clostridium sp. CAG:253]
MNTLKAEKRNAKAKALRREGYVTGNLFGREIEGSIPVKMAQKDVSEVLRYNDKGSQLFLEVEGKKYDVVIKEIDYDNMAKHVLDIEFQALVSNEKIHNTAEIILLNKEKVVEGVLEELLEEVSYKAYPADLVDKIKLDVGSLRLGDTIKVKDLDISKNDKIEVTTDPETIVVNVIASKNDQTDDDEDTSETAAE